MIRKLHVVRRREGPLNQPQTEAKHENSLRAMRDGDLRIHGCNEGNLLLQKKKRALSRLTRVLMLLTFLLLMSLTIGFSNTSGPVQTVDTSITNYGISMMPFIEEIAEGDIKQQSHVVEAVPSPVNDIILLNETYSFLNRDHTIQPGPKIDILIIGSRHQLQKAQVQNETWGSHPSRRHFFLATEYDDHDIHCEQNYTIADLKKEVQRSCKGSGLDISLKAPRTLRDMFLGKFSGIKWLMQQKKPVGWYCAMRRPSIGLAKVTHLYRDIGLDHLPDYLFIVDDDSYVNLDHITEILINQPQRLEAKGISQEHSAIPTHDTPVVWTGCRVRWPVHQVNFTFGYGGFGYFFSKNSLERLLRPLHCDSTVVSTTTPPLEGKESAPEMSSYVKDACIRLKPENALIGEDRFFNSGMTLIDVWNAMTQMNPFCMHADWIYGYFVNHNNISRHTVHSNGLNWFDDRFHDLPESRLHALKGDSESYGKQEGLCVYDGHCEQNATICHHMNETKMRNIHNSCQSNVKNYTRESTIVEDS